MARATPALCGTKQSGVRRWFIVDVFVDIARTRDPAAMADAFRPDLSGDDHWFSGLGGRALVPIASARAIRQIARMPDVRR